MGRFLAHALENLLARTFGRAFAEAFGDWWGWGPVAIAAYLVLRRLHVRFALPLSALAAGIVFVIGSLWFPVQTWLADQGTKYSATQTVRDALIDASSARFSDVSVRRLQPSRLIVCGYVNAKARNGAFQGPQLFMVGFTNDSAIPELQIDSACYVRRWRPFERRPVCETTVRSELEDRMLSGWAHRSCTFSDEERLGAQ